MSDSNQHPSQQVGGEGNFATPGPQNIGTVIQNIGTPGQPPRPRPWCVPASPDRFFGRTQEIETVAKLIVTHQRVALTGPGGIGKTALAAEAIKHLDPKPSEPKHFPGGIYSHDYYSLPQHAQALERILGQGGHRDVPDGQREGAVQALLNQPGVFLYLEGCEKAENLPALLNLVGSARVLLTSRDTELPGAPHPHPVKPLDDTSAAQLLQHHAVPGLPEPPPEAGTEWKDLAVRLGRHPLGLILAGRHLRGTGKTPGQFLERLTKDGFNFWDRSKQPKENLQVLFQHTAEAVKARHPQALAAWYVLCLHGYSLVPQAILAEVVGAPDEIEEALKALHDYSVGDHAPFPAETIGRTETAWQLNHALLTEWGREHLGALLTNHDDLVQRWQARWTADLQRVFAQRIGAGGPQRYQAMLPIWQGVAQMWSARWGEQHWNLSATCNAMAVSHSFTGNYYMAEPLYRRALESSERVLGPEHPDTLASLNNLANLLSEKGDRAGAEPLYRRALETRERVLGPEHPDTLTSLNNLAVLLRAKGDRDGAEPLYRRALETSERVLGTEHPDTLTSVNNLANLLNDKGDRAGAEPLYRRALETRERVLGSEHPDTLASLNNLAVLLSAKGDMAGAEPLYRRAVTGAERVLGKEHPDTQFYRRNLESFLAGLAAPKGKP